MSGLYVPPVLRGCTFVGMEDYDRHTALVFLSGNPGVETGVVRVVLKFKGAAEFIYTLFDEEARTLVHYEGPYGDPAKDIPSEVHGT